MNQLVPGEYSAGAMTGRSSPGAMGTGGAQTFTSFYDRYCGSKPCMFSEMGGASLLMKIASEILMRVVGCW